MDGLNINGGHSGLPETPARQQAKLKTPTFIVNHEAWSTGFFRRIKEFLTERPVKVPAPTPGSLPLVPEEFRSSFADNFREFFQPTPRALQGPVDSRFLTERKSGVSIFLQNVRDLISPPKLPPLKITSKPIPVRDIWSKDEVYTRAQSLSVLAHVLVGLLLIIPFIHKFSTPTQAENKPLYIGQIDISPYITKLPAGKDKAGGGGGGGERNPVPASKGKLPKFSLNEQLARPVVVIQNPNPKLAVDPTVVVPPDIRVPQPNLPNTGDPLAAMVSNSGGPGSGSGIGTGSGGGVGSGSGPGVGPGWGGGIGGGGFRPGHDGVGYPVCAYCPTPQFSEEARKAKHQGSVILHVIVQTDGRATNVSVVRGLGLGLDEKAIEAVRGWRLTPAMGPGGKPVPVSMDIEVVFRIM
ncbi:MAG: energy transducer TonB [Acidipila sp.]|nr:energy transducer TonB [Acidipila sp.]